MLGPSGLEAARSGSRAALPGAELHGPRDGFGRAAALILYRDLASTLRELFAGGRPIVGAVRGGILIRVLAPLLADKRSEPPVVALAEDGSVAVPLLGGHHGANGWPGAIAAALGCPAAITTAGDAPLRSRPGRAAAGWRVRNPEAAKAVVSALLGAATSR